MAGRAVSAVEHIDGRREAQVAHHHETTHVIPPAAAGPWLELAQALAAVDADPPCAAAPDRWFASGRGAGELLEAAVHGCRGCPVVAACGAYAVAADEREGVWGGVTPAERDAERRAAREARRHEARRSA